MRSHMCLDQRPCEVENRGCSGLSVPDLSWKEHAVEPRTGIEFPMILDSILAGERNCNLTSKVSTKLFRWQLAFCIRIKSQAVGLN